MSREEHASGFRGIASFPPEWGPPRGRPDSGERVAWVRSKIEAHPRSGLGALRALAARDEALARAVELAAKRKGPAR